MIPPTDSAAVGFKAPSADLLFVFAGADWRKETAVAAWRSGAARVLGMSIGRFEWRRVAGLGLQDDGDLRARVEETPPPRRHFLLLLEREGARERGETRRIPVGRLGTWSEARALAALVAERGAREVILCTSGYHMPRARLAVRRAVAATGHGTVTLRTLAVPEPRSSPLAPGSRWRSPRAWILLVREALKWILYAILVGTRKGAPDRSKAPFPSGGGSPPPRD